MHKSIAPISLLLALVAVSPAHAAPTEITACGTISQPGSYVLAQNLSASSGDCLVIAIPIPAMFGVLSNDVTINLAGFMITGTGTGTGIIRGFGTPLGNPRADITNITVRNGTITGFHSGVDLSVVVCVSMSINGVISCNPSALGRRTFDRLDVVEGLRVTTSSGPDEDVTGGFGISASGIVRDNQVFAAGKAEGINAAGRVTGNQASTSSTVTGAALSVPKAGSTVIGNNVIGRLIVSCPSNVTNNTSSGALVLLSGGVGCTNRDNNGMD